MSVTTFAGIAGAAALVAAVVAFSPPSQQPAQDPLQGLLQLQNSSEVDGGSVRPITELLFAQSLNSKEMGILAEAFACTKYSVVPSSVNVEESLRGDLWVLGSGQLVDGTELVFPATVEVGQSVQTGILYNAGSMTAVIQLSELDNPVMELSPGEMIFIGDVVIGDMDRQTVAGQCGVTCQASYFACCKCTGQIATCTCCRDDTPQLCPVCDAGGQGSSGCSICCNCQPG